MHELKPTTVSFGKERKDCRIAVPNNGVVWALADDALQIGPMDGGTRFSVIAKCLIELAAAILVHCLPAARGCESAFHHVIERRCSVAAGADANCFQHRERIIASR